jgi:hypothetical protein
MANGAGPKGSCWIFRGRAAVAKRYACKVFLEMRDGTAAVIEDGLRLELTFAIDEIPHIGLWINHGGWSPTKRMKPYQNFALQPCIGAPDTLEEALGAGRARSGWIAESRVAGRCDGVRSLRRRSPKTSEAELRLGRRKRPF